jgi:hypothetical protein
MAVTKIGILYSASQRKRRATLVPDDDSQLSLMQRRNGEVYIEQSVEDYRNFGPDHAVTVHAGGPPLSDRCAVVDSQENVVAVVGADPAIDEISGHTIVQHFDPHVGDRFVNGQLQRRYALTDSSNVVQRITWSPPRPPQAFQGGGVFDSLTAQVGDVIVPLPMPVDDGTV